MKKAKIKNHYESTAKLDTSMFKFAVTQSDDGAIEYRKNLLIDMGVMSDETPPIFIINMVGKWINPYFVAKVYGETGYPIEMMLDRLERKYKEVQPNFRSSDYWYEWCDFWVETFLKGDINRIRENFIINPK